MGQKKRQGWERYGQLIADNMIFIHMKFQDLQQKQAGVRLQNKKKLAVWLMNQRLLFLN